jgi:hypothetical protein
MDIEKKTVAEPSATGVARTLQREKHRLRAALQRVPGLLPLLMKPRNGAPWSREDRAALREQLRGLSHLGLYAVFIAIPGTSLVLPLLAWWLDRRTRLRDPEKPEAL